MKKAFGGGVGRSAPKIPPYLLRITPVSKEPKKESTTSCLIINDNKNPKLGILGLG